MLRWDTGGGCLSIIVLFFIITHGLVYIGMCISNGACP